MRWQTCISLSARLVQNTGRATRLLVGLDCGLGFIGAIDCMPQEDQADGCMSEWWGSVNPVLKAQRGRTRPASLLKPLLEALSKA
jgi:hypothetical protein